MQDKREIGYCIDRLEKIQYFKKRVINTIIERVTKLKYLKFRESHNFTQGLFRKAPARTIEFSSVKQRLNFQRHGEMRIHFTVTI